ncbi:MAG TPA: hypothetical protein P5311_00955, partial [Candidatus Dojkabacteria bacterium]|nr:hypothetical protein [Candidatus Dojkabacteria bacterium]
HILLNNIGGDLIIYPNAGGIGYDGNSVGQAIKIFYVDDVSDSENPVYWAIDLNNYEGKARVYKWKDIEDPHLGISYLLTNSYGDIDN